LDFGLFDLLKVTSSSHLIIEVGRAVLLYDVHAQTDSTNEQQVLQERHEGTHYEGYEQVEVQHIAGAAQFPGNQFITLLLSALESIQRAAS
jgi:hypothetical protein